MGKGLHLGEFEQLVLLAVARCQGEGYGVTIRRELERRARRRASVAAVYGTLERLVAKGYLSTHLGEATPQRGGRAKQYYRLQPAGVRALIASRRALDRMWEDLDLGVVPG
jgi:PadR family transcriptional regulator PadR